MRRAGWFRSLAAVVELWLVAVLLGHGTIYTCPEHDGARQRSTRDAWKASLT